MGGGGKGAKTASAPDYTALAQQQGAINQQTAQQITQANRPNQYDPFGNSITWTQTQSPQAAEAQRVLDEYKKGAALRPDWDQGQIDAQIAKYQQAVNDAGGAGTWSQQQTLNPETKAAWESYMKNANQATSAYGGILNKYLADYNAPDQGGQDEAFTNALYGSVMDRGRVEQQRESDALTSQLRNSGLQPGSEAYNRAMQNLMTSQNDANLLASQNAVLAGRQEYRNTRNQPLQELAGMAGIAGGQPYTPTYQGFSGATGYNPTDLVGAAQAQYGAKQQGANASNSKKSGLMGAGASLGGSYLGSK
jgi:hypothetical protein